MTRVIRKFLALPWAERWLLMQAMAALPLVTLTLMTVGPRRCYQDLARLTPIAPGGALTVTNADHRASRTAWLVRIASLHGLAKGSCLAQSLTVWFLLRRQGIPASLRIGVRLQHGRLEAHAWTEHRNRVLDDDADIGRRFSAFGGVGGVLEHRGAELP